MAKTTKTETEMTTIEIMSTSGVTTKYPLCAVIGEGKAIVCFTEYRLTKSADGGKVILRLFADKKCKNQVAMFLGICKDFRLLNEYGNEFTGICEQCGGDFFGDEED